jgi:hypothetical protein
MTPNPHREAGAQFTPGPWSFNDDWGIAPWSYALNIMAGDNDEVWLASTTRGFEGNGEEGNSGAYANARLIAAAPELFEALEPFAKLGRMLDGPFAPALFKDSDAIGMGGAWSENGEPRTITFGDLRRAAAALAKARGESA